MAAPTTLRRALDDAAFFLRNAERSLKAARQMAPDDRSELALGKASDHTIRLREVIDRQVNRLSDQRARA
jgi:hypothetical protein